MKRIKLFLALLGFITIGQFALAQPGSTFTDPVVVTSLPVLDNGATTCGFGNNYSTVDIACVGNFMSGEELIYAYTPTVNMPNMQVSITNITDNFSGLFVTDDSTATGTCMGSSYSPGSNDRVITNLSFNAGTTYYIIVSSWANPTCLSFDLQILDQTCPAPSNVFVSSPIGYDQAEINWTEMGSATQWSVEYGASGYTPGTGVSVVSTTNPVTLTGLLDNTIYDVYVKAICGAGDSSYAVGPLEITTSCAPLTDFVEDFESYAGYTWPSCWDSSIFAINTNPYMYAYQYGTPNGGVRHILTSNSNDPNAVMYLVYPRVSNLGVGTHRTRFYAKDFNYGNPVVVGTMSDPNDSATFTAYDTVYPTSVYTEFIVNFAGYSGTDEYIALWPVKTSTYQTHYFDDIVWEAIPTCPEPQMLSVSADTTSADLIWTEMGSATQWEVEYGAQGFTQGTGTSALTTSNPHSISGLTISTGYEYYVRSICGAGDSSTWTGPLYFFTNFCTPSATSVDGDGIVGVSMDTLNNLTLAEAGNYGDYSHMVAHASQSASLPVSVTYSTLTYQYYTYVYVDWNKDFDFSDPGETTYLGQAPGVGTITGGVLVPVTATVGESYRIRIAGWWSSSAVYSPCYSGSWATFEDYTLLVTAPPSCIQPTALTASNVTSSSADISWLDHNSSTSWVYEYGPVGFQRGTGTVVLTSSNPVTVSGLPAASAYDLYVSDICSSTDSSAWTGPVTFSTTCAAVSLISENFDLTPAYDMTDCWTGAVFSTSANPTVETYQYSLPYSGARHIRFYNSNVTTDLGMFLITPEISNLSAQTHQLRFYAKSGSTVYSNPLVVGTFSDVTDSSTFVAVDTIIPTSVYTEYTVPFDSYVGTGTHVAIRSLVDANYRYNYIDDVFWEAIPTCPRATNLNAFFPTIGGTSLAWTENGSATQWEVEYGPAGFVPGSGTSSIVSTNPMTVAGLTASTDYTFILRSICGPGDTSVWVGPHDFTTPCPAVANFVEGFESFPTYVSSPGCWTSTYGGLATSAEVRTYSASSPNNGIRHMQFYNQNDDSAELYLVTPQLSNLSAGTHRLRLYLKHDDSKMFIVGTMTNAADGATFTAMDTIYATNSYVEYNVDFSSYSGTDTYIGIKPEIDDTYQYSYADDIVWEPVPSCFRPTNPSAAVISNTAANFSWMDPNSATQWQVSYGVSGTAAGAGTLALTATTNYAATGLTVGTDYDLFVRTICAAGDTSSWTDVYSFSTGCAAVAAFTDNFDSYAGYVQSPGCFSSTYVTGGTGTVETYQYTTPNSGTRHMRFYNQLDIGARMYMVYPAVTNLNAGTHRTRFYAKSPDSYDMEIGTMSNPLDGNSFTPFDTISMTPTYSEYTMYFNGYSGTDMFIAMRPLYTNTYDYVYVDDVVWEASPACPAPTQGTAVVTDVTANMSWVENGSATQWELEYGTTGFAPGSGTATTVTTTNPHLATGLTQYTGYDFYVRSICGIGDTSVLAGPFSYETLCSAFPTPYLDDVEGHAAISYSGAISNCWSQDGALGYNYNWNVDQSGSTPNTLTGPDAAYSGSKYFYVEASYGVNFVEEASLYSAMVDASTLLAPRVKFMYHMYGADIGKLYVEVSDGTSWVTVDSIIGEQQTDYTDPWMQRDIALTGTYSTIQVRFRAVKGSGFYGDISLDDIRVVDTFSDNVAVSNVSMSGDECGVGMESIVMEITNDGTATQTSIPVEFSINDTVIATETWTGSLPSGDTAYYTFATMANFSSAGLNDVEAYTMLVGDSNLTNDTAMAMLGKTFNISTFPYMADFADGQQGWIIQNGANGSWAFGTPASGAISGAASDTNAFVTNLTGSHNLDEDAFVYSPCFDFSTLENPYVQMSTNYNSYTGDGANLEYSVDGGSDWIPVGNTEVGTNWYNYDYYLYGGVWTGRQTTFAPFASYGWQTSTLNVDSLGGMSNVKFRVRFRSNAYTNLDGFAFDDFAIYEASSLGSDTVLCTSETLTLDPGTYSGYLWNDSSIVPLQYLDAAVMPEGVDTISVIVSGPGGFKMFDTVVVTVEKPVIALGSDTVVCYGETVSLDAGTGFATYIWSDGSAMQTLITDGTTAGTVEYSVLGLTANDCPATDSIDVSVNTEVLVDLGVDTAFTDSTTQGTSYTLDAGPGFATYDWVDGSTNQTYFVDKNAQDGDIWVVVTNASGCAGTDTVNVDFKLGVNSLEVSSISMYPNPTTDRITIEVSNFAALGDVNVKILDITGKVVMIEKLQGNGAMFNQTYDVSTLATGTYFVQFEANGEVITRQFVIK